ncbi:hypothetical protein AHMF7605_01150 [Adhaeribacter arboris]|uniref:Uncharacterized protein n=1 Tax=Adhaeribacter arboris TaxID=2072846 RepID=A0A2T2Y9N2_9BACT|nr:hypothetical protein [Adhaeribacter arboris]PSR52224.1 hypothetical protein AHMF7605_01150 [Adhaeribacter arboris]
MKTLLLKGFFLSLVFGILKSPASMAATEQTPLVTISQNQPAPAVVDVCRTKQKVKKLVQPKAKQKKEQCAATPKNCYKPVPAADKPTLNKLPVLLPITGEVAFQENLTLPAHYSFATLTTNFVYFVTPGF